MMNLSPCLNKLKQKVEVKENPIYYNAHRSKKVRQKNKSDLLPQTILRVNAIISLVKFGVVLDYETYCSVRKY